MHLSYPWKRWRYVLEVTAVRYREPYNARHSFISWSLMINKNLLKLAQEDGHSVQTMLTTYAAWIKGGHRRRYSADHAGHGARCPSPEKPPHSPLESSPRNKSRYPSRFGAWERSHSWSGYADPLTRIDSLPK